MHLLTELETKIQQMIENYELKNLELEELKEQIFLLENQNKTLNEEKVAGEEKIQGLLSSLNHIEPEVNDPSDKASEPSSETQQIFS